MKTTTLHKQLLIGLSVGLLCCACSSTPIYKDAAYKTNTLVLNELKQSGKNPSPQRRALQAGEYDEYFDQISGSLFRYQLVYHHPGDLTADTDNYYIALVKIFDNGASTPVYASYNGTALPVAVEELSARPIEHSFFVNIRLTRNQLIHAYENTGKMVIPLTFGNKNYNVVFPDYYVRNVLAKTTNLTKYKVDERVASASAAAEKSTSAMRELFTYQTSFSNPYENFYPNYDQAQTVSFDVKTTKPELSLAVKFVRQYVHANANSGAPTQNSSYIKSISIQEKPGHMGSCFRIKASFDQTYNELTIRCNDLLGLPKEKWTIRLSDKITCGNCSILKHS